MTSIFGRLWAPGSGRVGLEIEPQGISAVQVAHHGGGISGWAREVLEPGVVRPNGSIQVSHLADALRSMFKESGLPRRVRLGISDSRLKVKTVLFPNLKKSDLASAIGSEAPSILSMDSEDSVVDYATGSLVGNGGPPKRRVLLAGAPARLIESYLEAADDAGLKVHAIESSGVALTRAVWESRRVTENHPEVVVDSNTDCLACAVVHLGSVVFIAGFEGRDCLFSKTGSSGILGVAEEISSRRGIDLQAATLWIQSLGLAGAGEAHPEENEFVWDVRSALERGTARLVAEIERGLQEMTASAVGIHPTQVILTGPGSAIPGMPEAIGVRLPIPSTTLAWPGQPSPIDPDLLVAYGLTIDGKAR